MTEYYSLFFIRNFYEWIAFYTCKFEFERGFGSYSMSGMAQLRFRLRLGWWYSVFVHFQEQILFGIWTFFMNEYYSVFGIRRISWTNIIRYSVFGSFSWTNTIRYSVFGNSSWTNIFGIRYSVKFTIRCNSGTDTSPPNSQHTEDNNMLFRVPQRSRGPYWVKSVSLGDPKINVHKGSVSD